jgi:hypothetical protein
MSQPIDFKIQFLEQIAAPLLSSIMAEKARADLSGDEPAESVKSEAQNMASFLGKSVELSTKLSDLLDANQAGDDAESIRVVLAAVAARLMADYHRISGVIADEETIKKLLSAMETALMFADNFTPDDKTIARLGALDPEGSAQNVLDEYQAQAQYMNIMAPVVCAVADYTFGRDEKKLIVEVAEKLNEAAKSAASSFGGDAEAAAKAKIHILKALALLYTDCHREEMKRIAAMTDDERAQLSEQSGNVLSMDNLWANFATRLAMLNMLTGMPERSKQAMQAPDVNQAPVAPPPSVEPSPALPEQEKPRAAVEESAAASPATQEQEAGGSPMSFFAKKPVTETADGDSAEGTSV